VTRQANFVVYNYNYYSILILAIIYVHVETVTTPYIVRWSSENIFSNSDYHKMLKFQCFREWWKK